ncbi:MAG: helix-turn-helix domain-containing protein [Acidobacteriota bacterium]
MSARHEAHGSLSEQLSSLLQGLMDELEAGAASVSLPGLATHGDRTEGDIALELTEPSRRRSRGSTELRASIRHAGRELGLVTLALPGDADLEKSERALDTLADRLALLAHRRVTTEFARRRFGQDLALVGSSKPLWQLERDIEQAARTELPVLVIGDFGTEVSATACAIHAAGRQGDGPFIELRCEFQEPDGFAGALSTALAEAEGGTLYLNRIDALSPSQLQLLPNSLDSAFGQWLGSGSRGEATTRFVASSQLSSRELAHEKDMPASLAAELDVLSIQVPSLRDRATDIPHLVEHFRLKHGGEQAQLDDAVLRSLCQHSWPGNVFELERVIARLVALRRDETIRFDDLARLAPQVLPERQREQTDEWSSGETPGPTPAATTEGRRRLARSLLAGDRSSLDGFHPGLQRALVFLTNHHAEEITVARTAREAYLSASHLAHLFKQQLGTSLRPMLATIRIERSLELLLADRQRRVTDIALDSGFGDLSHFLRTFKRIVGMSPRDHRRKALLPAELAPSPTSPALATTRTSPPLVPRRTGSSEV